MGPYHWSEVGLEGQMHAIPGLCPNCLEPADVPLRYKRTSPVESFFYPFAGSVQTFVYCETCAESARAAILAERVRRGLSWMLSLIFLSFVFMGLILLVVGPHSPLRPLWMKLMEATHQWIILIWPVGTILLAWFIARWTRKRMMRRHPKNDRQAAWGLAAYYKGDGVYTALRTEWIAALVEENQYLVDAETYRLKTGHDRPGG